MSLRFCPRCGNLLSIEQGPQGHRFACSTCPYIHNITHKISSRTYYKRKEFIDVQSSSAAWEGVDSTDERCPQCSHPRAYYMQLQTRSADEPMTIFYRCCDPKCMYTWREG
ncbi:PREDICTED: DNA-directed RNA polymerase III subunit RPC10-like isoform X2 [Dinoponera quadriceps]|uniref:DNA-directed RNA polymerase subunit n=1 Tax=Dinoponera quadriceps TaxID=609295 RepID=A0A6P3X4L0_DINQU|nr:PREDICTED: DNA-directed RNA polymerase III subunit RPC10-like isoform X2 [Dinoponera quadriceps]